jgi:hypothetical protein
VGVVTFIACSSLAVAGGCVACIVFGVVVADIHPRRHD